MIKESSPSKKDPDYADFMINLASEIPAALFYEQSSPHMHINYYFCQAVMDLAGFLRRFSKTAQLSSQHNIFTDLFNRIVYQKTGLTEVKIGAHRIDLLVPTSNLTIEIKTISEVTLDKLYEKAFGVVEAEPRIADNLWIFYFYKLAAPISSAPLCKYLLVHIDINMVTLDLDSFRSELVDLVEESKKYVAEKLQIRPALILPLENLIKVEDLERLVAEKDHAIAEKDQEIQRLKELLSRLQSKNI